MASLECLLRSLFLLLLLISLLNQGESAVAPGIPRGKPKIQPNDTIVFYGGSKVWFAQHREDGFVNLIKRQASHLNVTVYAEGFRNASITTLRNSLEERILNENLYQKPTFLIVMVGDDDILGKEEGNWMLVDPSIQEVMASKRSADPASNEVIDQYFRLNFHTELQSLLSLFVENNKNTTVILCSPTIYGELYDGNHVFDGAFEMLTGAIQSVTSEFTNRWGGRAAFLNLRLPMLKYLERSNFENVPAASILTYDGHHLNEDGHTLVALTICQFLGIPIEATIKETTLTNGTTMTTKTEGLDTQSLNLKLQRGARWKAEEMRLKKMSQFQATAEGGVTGSLQ